MNAAALVDTNVLVYMFDEDAADKRTQAIRVMRSLVEQARGVASAQVLGEFYVVLVRKFPSVMLPEAAVHHVRQWADALTIHDTSARIVLEALRGVVRYGFSYYDAQIWACARVHQIPLVLSEDFADGTLVEGVRFADPFAPGFDLEALLA